MDAETISPDKLRERILPFRRFVLPLEWAWFPSRAEKGIWLFGAKITLRW